MSYSARSMLLNGAVIALIALTIVAGASAEEPQRPFYRGADLSMLPVLEKAGARFSDHGKTDDLTKLLAKRGCNLIRLRLFVDPNPDYLATHGAVQDLPFVLAMAKRVKAAGEMQLLDLHYSDSWADPKQQDKPKAWADLHGEALEQKVYDYTVETLTAFKQAGVLPELVQVGNEITPGMLHPDGKVAKDSPESWQAFAALMNAGIRGVRAVQEPEHPIRIMIHIHGGGRAGLPQYFLKNLSPYVTDFDLIGLSFYPGINERLTRLSKNIADLAATYKQQIVVAETAYPNAPIKELRKDDMEWPTTPDGQKQFMFALRQAIEEVPDHQGAGFIYWYPEAINVPNLWVWRSGALAMFDENGATLPSVEVFSPKLP